MPDALTSKIVKLGAWQMVPFKLKQGGVFSNRKMLIKRGSTWVEIEYDPYPIPPTSHFGDPFPFILA